jgi:hypothetical protein
MKEFADKPPVLIEMAKLLPPPGSVCPLRRQLAWQRAFHVAAGFAYGCDPDDIDLKRVGGLPSPVRPDAAEQKQNQDDDQDQSDQSQARAGAGPSLISVPSAASEQEENHKKDDQ